MEEFEHSAIPEVRKPSAEAIVWSEHIVLVFPLWLGTIPAMLKAVLEQVLRRGTAFAYPDQASGLAQGLLGGRSARIVVTMGMPEMVYRLWFRNHGLAGIRRDILNFVGIADAVDDADHLVARDEWQPRVGKIAVHHMQVGSANGTSLDPQPNFTTARHWIVPLGRLQGRPDLLEQHCSHGFPKPHTVRG